MVCKVRCWILKYIFFERRRRHTRWNCDWSSDVCSSDVQVACLGRDGPVGKVLCLVDGLQSFSRFCEDGFLEGTKLPAKAFLDLGNEPYANGASPLQQNPPLSLFPDQLHAVLSLDHREIPLCSQQFQFFF